MNEDRIFGRQDLKKLRLRPAFLAHTREPLEMSCPWCELHVALAHSKIRAGVSTGERAQGVKHSPHKQVLKFRSPAPVEMKGGGSTPQPQCLGGRERGPIEQAGQLDLPNQ